MNGPLSQLADELERDLSSLERELAEIELLLRQTATEAERHEARRVQAEERVTALEEGAQAPTAAVHEAREQLLTQTRRATLMQSQMEVLAGKQRSLQRYQARLAATLPVVLGAAAQAGDDAVNAPQGSAGGATGEALAANGTDHGATSGEVLAAQEHMRREIARKMHDGPAQSIANIALQAQIVRRLFDRQPERAQAELEAMVAMVEHALAATTDFIFDVRPMVLDDLGLVPTLRRWAAERSRRSGVSVRFESSGPDRRLATELESAFFRIVDDAVTAYVASQPTEVLIRLDWTELGMAALVRGRPEEAGQNEGSRAQAAVAAARRQKLMPAALASMIRDQERVDAARAAGLPASTWAEIEQRAGSAGITVSLTADRWLLGAHVGPS